MPSCTLGTNTDPPSPFQKVFHQHQMVNLKCQLFCSCQFKESIGILPSSTLNSSWSANLSCVYFQKSIMNHNWVVVSNMFYFHPYLGKIPILTDIFQRGWNHQLDNDVWHDTTNQWTLVWVKSTKVDHTSRLHFDRLILFRFAAKRSSASKPLKPTQMQPLKQLHLHGSVV